MNDKIDSALKRASLHAQALREDAKQSELPDDPAAWLDWQEQRATALPDDLPQKEYVLRCVQIARGQLSNENTLELRAWMIKIQKNMKNAEFDKWVSGVEKQFGKDADARREQVELERKPHWDKWQAEADNIRDESKINLSKSEVARRIKKRLNLNDSERTIRNRIT